LSVGIRESVRSNDKIDDLIKSIMGDT